MATKWKCYKRVFRDGWLKALKSDTNLLISDTMTPGLHLRFYATSRNIAFYLAYIVKGTRKRRNIKIGNYTDFKLKDVRDRAGDLRKQVAAGLDPMQEREDAIKKAEAEKRARMKVSDLLELYYEKYSKIYKKPKTQETDRYQINLRIKPMLGHLYTCDLDLPTLMDFYNEMKEKTSACTANHTLSLLSAIWNWAETYGHFPLNSNPCKRVPRAKEKHATITPLSLDEYKKLFKALEDGLTESPYSPRMFRALRLLMLTGCRTSEITMLKKSNVKLDEKFIYLDDSKNGVEKMPLSDYAVEEIKKALDESPADSPMLFPATRGGADAVIDLRKAHQWALNHAGLRHIRKHDFRHSFISIGTGTIGVSAHLVQKTIGHKKLATTEMYSHIGDKTRLETANKINMAMLGE